MGYIQRSPPLPFTLTDGYRRVDSMKPDVTMRSNSGQLYHRRDANLALPRFRVYRPCEPIQSRNHWTHVRPGHDFYLLELMPAAPTARPIRLFLRLSDSYSTEASLLRETH